MNLRWLRYFEVLAEELHFGRAAARLHISQPPLSQQIRLLEEELGTTLFERSHHRVELTAAGRVLQRQAPLVFRQLDRALDLTRQAGRGQVGELAIGMISSVMVGVLPRALNLFRERYHEVEWQLHEMTPAAQLVALKERRVDVCIFRGRYEDPELRNELLMWEPIQAVLPAGHPLAAKAVLAPKDLAGERFVALELKQSHFASLLFQSCIQAGFTPLIRQQVIEVQTLLSLVRAQIGVAVVPASIKQLAPDGVVFRSLEPALPEVPLYATSRADDASPVLKLFLDTLHELVVEDEQNRRSVPDFPGQRDGTKR
ncbi:LysR substrate-binding domain-containing protein [Marinobacterium sedimentorum]|uniref:LysR substrate-binding domain-containing protein n=1 Tax=Marinobacterium sedimentorum TaxID=2927804 RepID=UPI0020C62781|nr:LysR substrate-binding domain-containing protein [Marinobacterium sedimentorum]MCP8687716.1 LysR substrate-binding domain-containing protein [Marinobacterium sedimentorum]